jgi:hypothetical protein
MTAKLTIVDGDRTILDITRAEAVEMGLDEALIVLAETQMEAATTKAETRARIAHAAGDTQSLLGTTTDALQMLLVHVANMTVAIAAAKDIVAIKAAAQPLADLTAPLLKQIAIGDVRMPFVAKGEVSVLADSAAQATAVADALSPQKEATR